MSLRKLENIQLQDVFIKYEALEQELKVLKLENQEYKKDILQLQEKNTALTEDINSYKEMLEIGQHHLSLSFQISNTLDALEANNEDLTAQIEETEQEIAKSHQQNLSLENENKRCRSSLEKLDGVRQKREEIHMKNKLKLENKIKELQQENDALRIELSSIKIDVPPCQQQDIEEEKQCDPKASYSQLVRIASSGDSEVLNEQMEEFTLTHAQSLDEAPAPQIFERGATLNSVDRGIFDFTKLSSYKPLRESSRRSSYDSNENLLTKQSTTNVYDTDILTGKLEEIKELKRIKDENESLIAELQEEIMKLRQTIHKIRHQPMDGKKTEPQFCSFMRCILK